MVKIAEIRATAHSCPITQNVIRLGLGRNVKRDFVCVRVITDDGTVGYGEAHHGQNLTAMAEIVEKGLGSLLIGEDPFDTEGIWNRIKYQQIQTHGLGAGSVIVTDVAADALALTRAEHKEIKGAAKRLRRRKGSDPDKSKA